MSEYLYVCHFSNGHIKVGRSISPKSRIASHADRVACVGIELVEHHIVECVGHSASAEFELIERCAELCTKRNMSEWFEGLEYIEICELAEQKASGVFLHKSRHSDSELIDKLGGTAEVARICEVKPPSVSEWRTAGIPPARLMYLKVIKPEVFANRGTEKAAA